MAQRDPHERQASVNRAAGIRSRYQRCPRCKKLRMKWMKANHWWGNRKNWAKDKNGVLTCFICVERHPEDFA